MSPRPRGLQRQSMFLSMFPCRVLSGAVIRLKILPTAKWGQKTAPDFVKGRTPKLGGFRGYPGAVPVNTQCLCCYALRLVPCTLYLCLRDLLPFQLTVLFLLVQVTTY
ncbi:hypothetical protein FKM82_030446 [Ascaphus truei]